MWPYLLAVGALQAKDYGRDRIPAYRWLVTGVGGGALAATLLYALAFAGMYLRPHYRLLFSEQLGFRLADVETSYPQLGPVALVDEPLAGTVLPRPDLPQPAPIALNLGRADESHSVYDHPRVLIFQKTEAMSPEEIAARIRPATDTSWQCLVNWRPEAVVGA